MRAVYLLCLVLTTAMVQGNPRVKRDAELQSTEKRSAFLSDLGKVYSFEKQFPRDGQLHDKGLKAAQAVREYREAAEAWQERKNAQDRRESALSDLQKVVGFEKQFSRGGQALEASETGLKARESRFLNDVQETLQFLQEGI